tara:strand:+ start:583 stop:879 length:297 start_codon:yes stop_codon:yes gene_type:complete
MDEGLGEFEDIDACFDSPISETSSPAVVIVALSKWITLMRAMDASNGKRHREVLTVLIRLVHIWAEELQDNPSYDELGQQLVDNIVGAVETKYQFGSG